MKLTIKQRFFLSFIYILIMAGIGKFYNTDFSLIFNTDNPFYVVFIAAALMLILGSYITEPYFSKPSDVIAKSIAMLLVLSSINNSDVLIGYNFLKWYSIAIGFMAIFSILLLEFPRKVMFQRNLTLITTYLGRPKIFFSILYLLALFSFFSDNPQEYVTLLLFWAILIFNEPIEKFIIHISNILGSKSIDIIPLGEAIGFQNPFLYKVEIDLVQNKYSYKKGTIVFFQEEKNIGVVGVLFNKQQLLNKQWLNIYVLKDLNNNPLKIDIKKNRIINQEKYIFSKLNQVFILNGKELDPEIQNLIENNPLVKNVESFIGYISVHSNINFVSFKIVEQVCDSFIGEGQILKTQINNKEVLYQVIDGYTEEEKLIDKDIHGFTTGKARKIGVYNNKTNELESVKWLPEIYTPIFINRNAGNNYNPKTFIGKLPLTDLGIPIKEFNHLITHNTAILGILGIGKSCLTFELIQKIIDNTDVKIICIDITNQYANSLKHYVNEEIMQIEISSKSITHLKKTNTDGQSPDKASEWGNTEEYKKILDLEIDNFVKEESTKRILILNPDWHSVAKASTQFKIQEKVDLTVSEKTRIISERLFIAARKEGETTDAKYLIVFEEAHSLVPEWNSVSNEGDKQATNGTAKVILQGRKYGLGSFVVTQRTANISKSILNQCNTIFALRVFDDTGKQFLENYIGQDYSNLLPNLEERQAIAIGRAMKLKQPVIIELNDMKEIRNK